MLIDFSPVDEGRISLYDFSQQFSVSDLKAATNASIGLLLDIIKDADDAHIVFEPHDPDAHDPYAPPEEQHIGWTLGHLIAHVTASSEEYAAYSSILARGIPYVREPRLRYETPWREINSKARAVQRLEESRRMRLAYLDTWPDVPHLDVLREISDRYREKFGEQNAKSAFILGLRHEADHYDQFREVARQAQASRADHTASAASAAAT